MPQDLSSKEDDIGFPILDDIVGLLGLGNDTNRRNENVLSVLLDMRSEGQFCDRQSKPFYLSIVFTHGKKVRHRSSASNHFHPKRHRPNPRRDRQASETRS